MVAMAYQQLKQICANEEVTPMESCPISTVMAYIAEINSSICGD